jgi:2-keto-4-pentenoate hydratase/2-oxohepta-3-ene-1,7-dioic acid hydratase in catechol pathway
VLVETRVNGEVRQSERTSNLIHDVAKIVAFTSRYVTLEPGDLIFTGTPGRTRRLAPGDVVEVTVEGVGILRNPVIAGR